MIMTKQRGQWWQLDMIKDKTLQDLSNKIHQYFEILGTNVNYVCTEDLIPLREAFIIS